MTAAVLCDRCGHKEVVPYMLPPRGWVTITADDPAVMNQHMCPECVSEEQAADELTRLTEEMGLYEDGAE